jgi:ribosomal subunit interface protein
MEANMNIDITGRGFTPSENLKTFINEKSSSLLKYDPNILNAKVVLIKEGRAEKVELIISGKKNNYIAKCYSSVFEKTVVHAISKIKSQIEKVH